MTYPNTDWPTSVDTPRVVSDGDVIAANDHNYKDDQVRAAQTWLGEDGDLIGEGATSAQGPGGLASPIADGGTAVTLAAKADYTSGKLLSVGDNYDAAYSEKASVDFEGKAVFAGVQLGATNAVTSILDEDTMASDSATALATQQSVKAYADTEIASAVAAVDLWGRSSTVLSPKTSGDTIAVGVGAVGAPGVAFEGSLTTGLYLASSEILSSIAGVKTAGIAKASNIPYMDLYREDTHGTNIVGAVTFNGKDAVGVDAEYAQIMGYADSAAGGSEVGSLIVKTATSASGALTTSATISGEGTVFDPGSRHTKQTVTSSSNQVAVDCENGYVVHHVLTENTTIQPPTNEAEPIELIFWIDGDGSSTISFTTGVTAGGFWKESAWPSLGSDDRMIVKFMYDSANDWWVESGRTVVQMASGS